MVQITLQMTSPNFQGHNLSSNLLNGKNIDEIPEFQPGSTPTKSKPDEFHFGPNAAPFTPKHHDQSEAMSTKAIFGDDSAQNIETSFTSTEATSPAKSPLKKESDDPMSMSFYANRNDHNPFDLNKVQMLPDNLDEFLHQSDNSAENETSEQKSGDLVMNNDDALQTTDLDKHSYDDEKELASPLEPEKELSCPDFRDDGVTPEPTNENLLCGDFCQLSEKSKTPEPLPRDVELISPDSAHESPQSRPESIPPDVELLSPQPQEQIPQSATEVADLLGGFDTEQQQDLLCERPQSNSPMCEKPMSESPMCERPMSESPMCERPMSESPLCDKLETQSSVCERPESKSPVCERLTSPDFEERETKEEEMKQVEIEPEEPQKEKEEEDVQATIVIGAQDVIEIEEEPSEYIPSPAAEPVDMEPQVIEPVQDLCPLEKPSVNTEVFELGDVQDNKETDLDKPVGEVEVRMENISPQFAEQAFVMTPSEESKQEDVPTAPLVEATVPELLAAPAAVPPLTSEPSAPAEPTAAETAAVAAAGVAAAATVAVAAAAVAAKPAAEDKKRTPVAAKKVPATKTASPSPRVGAKPAAGAAAKAKTTPVAAKTSPAKTATTAKSSVSPAASKPAAATRMPASKPKTIPVPKPAERKPSTNGDVKQPPIRATLAAKKPASETTATKTTTRPSMTARPATAAPRTTASAPKSAPRPTTAPKVAAPRTNGTTTSAASRLKLTTTKKSPVTSKTASTATKTGASLPLKTTSSAPAKPAFTTSTKPKPASTAAPAAPKPRVPLSRRPATETDKQSKEAVNKATAGRTTATRTGVTALRKVETKTATTTRTTVMKSTTTTMKSNATKKPAEIVRNKSAKTTTQKTEISEKPEMNGITDKAPESLQVVPQTQNEVFNTDSESQLVKDNSPSIDNKTIENTLIQTNTAD
ncbi:unnamed protein product [Acanthoscelides obtectus]|uniref:Ataxin-2 C-terminal domain-containing protein n=1 Tax=Acanthoscelides obtectus TaxID=200917 RepID=A0A9P0M6Z0_ACAOB|nr:unnamed protein product [Acanthoscelides obtectus]CAK1622499.1 Translation initiation factor IF-2 [Acanthoscelides obtectus]